MNFNTAGAKRLFACRMREFTEIDADRFFTGSVPADFKKATFHFLHLVWCNISQIHAIDSSAPRFMASVPVIILRLTAINFEDVAHDLSEGPAVVGDGFLVTAPVRPHLAQELADSCDKGVRSASVITA